MRHFRYIALIAIAFLIPSMGFAQTPEATSDQTTATGTALDMLPPGDPDTVSVVAAVVDGDGDFWVVVRNNTEGMVTEIELKVTVRDEAGKLVAVGNSSEVRIANLDQGEIAIGRIGGADLSQPLEGLEVEFDVTWEDGENDDFFPKYDLEFLEATWSGDRILGEFRNPSNVLMGNVYLAYACFDSEGNITSAGWGSAHGKLSPGDSTAFQIGRVNECEHFVVSGYGNED